MEQSHYYKRWSKNVGSVLFLTLFSIKVETPIFSAAVVKKTGDNCQHISNTAVTKRESIKESLQLRSCIVKTVNKNLGCCELKVIFHSQQFISL